MNDKVKLAPETISAQALQQIDSSSGGLIPTIRPSSTYVRDENYQLVDARRAYGRERDRL
ncbi:MAG: hypothetical protein WAW79_04970 [Steroidobacteraceae bacterium]